jgi:hypothetical protein
MAKKMFSNGFALAVLALSAIRQADAFVVKPSASHGTSSELNLLPNLIKKGEKVETEVDAGILVQAAVRAHIIVTDRVFQIWFILTGICSPTFVLIRVT